MLRTLIAALFVLFFCATPLVAGTIRDDSYHFSFEAPPGWVAMSPAEVEKVNAAMKGGSNYKFVAGVHPISENMPYYIMVQQIKKPSGDPSGHVDEICAALKSTGAEVGSVSYDERRVAYISEMRVATNSGLVNVVSYAFFGSNDAIVLHCYSSSVSSSVRRTFDDAADSFQFDSGYKYSRFSFTSPTGMGVTGGIIVGFFLLRRVFRTG